MRRHPRYKFAQQFTRRQPRYKFAKHFVRRHPRYKFAEQFMRCRPRLHIREHRAQQSLRSQLIKIRMTVEVKRTEKIRNKSRRNFQGCRQGATSKGADKAQPPRVPTRRNLQGCRQGATSKGAEKEHSQNPISGFLICKGVLERWTRLSIVRPNRLSFVRPNYSSDRSYDGLSVVRHMTYADPDSQPMIVICFVS